MASKLSGLANVLSYFQDGTTSQSPSQTRKAKEPTADNTKDGLAYNCLLKNELLGAGIEDIKVRQTLQLLGLL
jgi:cell division cycle 20-like protein 1 (cofactor of APC complex)